MSAYMLVEIMIKDPAPYEEYMDRIPAVIAAKGGRYVVRSSRVTPVAGGWSPDRIIMMEFDDMDALRACFGSDEYKQLATLREAGTVTRSVVIEP